MAYPKPLSEKSLEKLYLESGLSDESRTFLHDLFAACMNLYGAIALRDIWEIYKHIGNTSPKIRRKDLVTFSAIVRREVQPYQIYEIEELYEAEPHNDLDRHIVSKSLVTGGNYKFIRFYEVMKNAAGKPYYIPNDLLAWKNPAHTADESALYSFLEELAEKNADEFFHSYTDRSNLGIVNPTRNFQYLMEDLAAADVHMDQARIEELARLTTDYHNNSHLWCNAEWTPIDLSRAMFADERKPVISFGPGYQQAFADGTLDRDELVHSLRKNGFEVAELRSHPQKDDIIVNILANIADFKVLWIIYQLFLMIS